MARKLTADKPREYGSINGAFDASLAYMRSAQNLVTAACGGLEDLETSSNTMERLANKLAVRIGEVRKTVSSAPLSAPPSASSVLDQCADGLKQVQGRLLESEIHVARLMDEAKRFRRLRTLIDSLRSLFARRISPATATSLDSVRNALERAASANRTTLEKTGALHQDLRQAVDARDRHGSQLASAIGAARTVLTEAGEPQLPTSERVASKMCEAARAELRRAVADVARSEEAVHALAEHARRYQDDILLIGSIMCAETPMAEGIEQAFVEFDALLLRYREEAQQDDFPAEAEAFEDLQDVRSKMARVRFAPRLAGKNVVAVAGGFSSGKSSFINSLIGPDSHLLPTQTTPTTSIPTYVHYVPDTPLEIACFNNAGGKHMLDDERKLHAITHDFEEKYSIPLKQIVDRLVVCTPDLVNWRRVAFVDTPGYTNPEGDGGERRDEDVALREVVSANYLVWVVDCERGTLVDTDVQYIKRFLTRQSRPENAENDDRAVYVVVNKADKKPSQGAEILEQICEVAKKHGIPCAGLGMYSAHEGDWYDVVGQTFNEFLDRVNTRTTDLGIKAEVEYVLRRYIEHHQDGANQDHSRVGLLSRIGMVIDEGPCQESELGEGSCEGKLGRAVRAAREEAAHQAARHETHARRYEALWADFNECLDRFMKPLGNRDSD